MSDAGVVSCCMVVCSATGSEPTKWYLLGVLFALVYLLQPFNASRRHSVLICDESGIFFPW